MSFKHELNGNTKEVLVIFRPDGEIFATSCTTHPVNPDSCVIQLLYDNLNGFFITQKSQKVTINSNIPVRDAILVSINETPFAIIRYNAEELGIQVFKTVFRTDSLGGLWGYYDELEKFVPVKSVFFTTVYEHKKRALETVAGNLEKYLYSNNVSPISFKSIWDILSSSFNTVRKEKNILIGNRLVQSITASDLKPVARRIFFNPAPANMKVTIYIYCGNIYVHVDKCKWSDVDMVLVSDYYSDGEVEKSIYERMIVNVLSDLTDLESAKELAGDLMLRLLNSAK